MSKKGEPIEGRQARVKGRWDKQISTERRGGARVLTEGRGARVCGEAAGEVIV